MKENPPNLDDKAMPEEETLWEGHPSRWKWRMELALCAMLLFLGLVLYRANLARFIFVPLLGAGFFYLRISLKRRGRRYTITNQRVIQQSGFLSKRVTEIEIADIRSINLEQSFPQRLVRIGNIEIASAASDGVCVRFVYVNNPDSVKEYIRRVRLAAPKKINSAEPF